MVLPNESVQGILPQIFSGVNNPLWFYELFFVQGQRPRRSNIVIRIRSPDTLKFIQIEWCFVPGVDQTVDDSVAGVETPLIESDNSIYTILIRLPPPSTAATESTGASSPNNSRRSRSASKSSRQAVSCSNNGSKLSSRSFEGNLSEVAASAGDCGRIQVRQLLTHLKSYLNTFGISTLLRS